VIWEKEMWSGKVTKYVLIQIQWDAACKRLVKNKQWKSAKINTFRTRDYINHRRIVGLWWKFGPGKVHGARESTQGQGKYKGPD